MEIHREMLESGQKTMVQRRLHCIAGESAGINIRERVQLQGQTRSIIQGETERSEPSSKCGLPYKTS